MIKTLEEILNNTWQELDRSQNDKKHPFRFGTFATLGDSFPNIRTVVLRKVEKKKFTLSFYTDFRSPKVKEVQKNPTIAWHFYHPKEQVQLRIYGEATIIHNSEISNKIWNNLPIYGKSDYLTQEAPSSIKKKNNTPLLSIDNSEYFCVITTKVKKIDWLQLNRKGHQRAIFELIQDKWTSDWLIP